MRLTRARVQNYRSIHDTGWFDVEDGKTILVGPNEAGKTAVLRALQTVNMPPGEEPDLDPLRDYPRARYTEIESGAVDPEDAEVASATFLLDDAERATITNIAPHLRDETELNLTSYHANNTRWSFVHTSHWALYKDVEKPLTVLKANIGQHGDDASAVLAALIDLTGKWRGTTRLTSAVGKKLDAWLETALPYLDLADKKVDEAFDAVRAGARRHTLTQEAYDEVRTRVPFFVYFSQYFKVRPRIHLGRLAVQQAAGDVDEEYDFGNLCLLSLLGFTASELAELGRGVPDVSRDHRGDVLPTAEEVTAYQDRLDRRNYKLNAASMTLSSSIGDVWGEERELDIQADGQYLKVVVRNEDGARVELDQGSEGFRWLVSFYVVFQAQARSELANAILLLDEPGVSLHALKQKQFRGTVSEIAAKNQTIFTTHSPFMVGTDELDLVRIVELPSRKTGTIVHEDFAVDDERSLFPLQAHLGYELGQTLFGQHRNLVVEGITDYWYLEGAAEAARDAGVDTLDEKVTIMPAGDAGKVVYHATVLHAQGLKMAALFDSDSAGDQAATQESFVSLVKAKQILRVGDFYSGSVTHPEIEDLLRKTLITVAKDELGIDATTLDSAQPGRPVCDLLSHGANDAGKDFSKYRLAKAFLRWMRVHGWDDLQSDEQVLMAELFKAANKATK